MSRDSMYSTLSSTSRVALPDTPENSVCSALAATGESADWIVKVVTDS